MISARPYIAVIDPASRVAELDCLNWMSQASALPLTYHLPALFGLGSLTEPHRSPDSQARLAGIVILGSGASVAYESHEWQDGLKCYVEEHLGAGTPMLGICYGHQLIAQLCGGRVAYSHEDQRKLTGWRQVRFHPEPRWGMAARTVEVVVSHKEEVKTCPPGFQVFATSDVVNLEGFLHPTRPIWTVQSHPEATLQFLEHQGITLDRGADAFQFGHGIVRHFLDYCASRQSITG